MNTEVNDAKMLTLMRGSPRLKEFYYNRRSIQGTDHEEGCLGAWRLEPDAFLCSEMGQKC